MTGRVRSRSLAVPVTGSATSKGVTQTITYQHGWSSSCIDTVGEWETDNSLSLDHQFRQSELAEGIVWNTSGTVVWGGYFDFPINGIANYTIPSPASQFPLPDLSGEVLNWLGRLQPGRASVNLPAVLGESRDIPDLLTTLPNCIRDWGLARFGRNASKARKAADLARRASGTLGSLYLAKEFGLDPTVSDALAMVGILDDFLRKLQEVNDLAKGKQLKRSLRLPPQRQVFEDGWVTTMSWPKTLRHNKVRVYNEVSWVTSRWAPLIPWMYSRLSPSDILEKARAQLLGLNPSGLIDAWWELLPWSWLADWIADIQRKLRLFTGNSLLLKCVSLCYCRTMTLDVYWAGVKPFPKDLELTGRSFHQRVIKQRIPLAQYVNEATFPVEPHINAAKAGILAALLGQYGSRVKLPRPKR